MEIYIEGNVLLLMGPIGNFFSRFARFLVSNNVEVYKINFPLAFELGFPKKHCRVDYFKSSIECWPNFLLLYLKRHDIKHIFVSADFYLHHQIAINIASDLNIDVYVFELGYVRPNFITLEKNQVNARSTLKDLAIDFYKALPEETKLLSAEKSCGPYWRKLFMPICFIQQTLNHNFKIIEGVHKSNPKFSFIYYQILGSIKKYIYKVTESRVNRKIVRQDSIFFVPLQVESDTQITLASPYNDLATFIEEVMSSFASFAPSNSTLVFKHHPADRGYTNFKGLIVKLSKSLNLSGRIFYTHDLNINLILLKTKGAITINSSVGLECLKANVPLKVMGEAFYDKPGLTCQNPLDDFWQNPSLVDTSLFIKFYNHMIRTTQINGHFQGYFPFAEVFKF